MVIALWRSALVQICFLMKKTFSMTDPRHKAPRVVAAIKSDVRKYLKRERRKALPEDAGHWAFGCRAGKNEQEAKAVHSAEIARVIDAAAEQGWPEIYIEILARPGSRRASTKDGEAGRADGSGG